MTKASAQGNRPAATAVERGADTRRRLESAALSLIAEVGWHGVSTRLVAERAGVGAGLVHYHYDSVSALLTAAVADVAARLGDDLVAAIDAQPDVERGIRAMVALVETWSVDNPVTIVLIEAALAATRSPDVRRALAGSMDTYQQAFGRWLADRGRVVDPGSLTVALAALDGLVLRRAVDPDLDLSMVATALDGLLAGAPPGDPT